MTTVVQIVPAMEQGGVERGVTEMNRALVAHGWRNVVLSSGGRLAETVVAEGGEHVVLDVKSKNPLTFFPRAYELRRVLRDLRPDAVCVHSRVPAWLFWWANRPLGIPWITFAHGANSISRYSRIMTAGDLTVTPSRYVADYLKEAYGIAEEKLRVIPRPVEKVKFDADRLDAAFVAEKRKTWGLDGKYVIMGVGRITQLKGYDTLVRALAQLGPLGTPPRESVVVIVGEAEVKRKNVEADLRRLVAELKLENRVVFAGNQSRVAECLSMADVVVSANTRKPEAFGRSMAEALAMGRPVVACAFGGAREIVTEGETGACVDPASADMPAAFAAAIRRVAGMRFGDLRTAALERFSFERMVASAISVYEEVMSNLNLLSMI